MSHLKAIALVVLFTLSSLSFAQDNEEFTAVKEKSSRKFVSLTIGIEHDEKMPDLPSDVKFGGDFKKVAQVSYASESKTIRFKATSFGVATLTILDGKDKIISEIRIDVKKSNIDKVVKEIRELLGDVEGIQIRIVNNKVVVDGQILLPKDMNRIYSVVRQYDGLAQSLVSLSPLAQRKIAELIERDINNPEIHARAVNEKFILEGVANSEDERAKAEIIAKTYVPDVIVESSEAEGVVKKRKAANDGVINLITVKQGAPPPPGKIVQLVVHYVELQKDYTKGFRFQWTPDLSDGSQMTFKSDSRSQGGVVSSITGTISNLLPKLNWAKQHGHARVLQSSSMIVQDGRKGELKSVTNVPYQIISKDGQPSTAFAEVGLKTAITPTILGARSDTLNLELDFGLSSLIGLSDAGPLTSQSQINTAIVVKSGQSAAIGGLIANSTSTGYNKLPKNAATNPIISLYASKDFQRQQSQFVVFVTPVIKTSASAGSEKIKKKFKLRE